MIQSRLKTCGKVFSAENYTFFIALLVLGLISVRKLQTLPVFTDHLIHKIAAELIWVKFCPLCLYTKRPNL